MESVVDVNESSLEVQLREWMKRVLPSGFLVLKAKQGASRPAQKYATYRVNRLNTKGTPQVRVLDTPFLDGEGVQQGDLTRTTTEVVEGSAILIAYGLGAQGWIADLRASVDDEADHEIRRAAGLSLIRAVDAADNTAFLDVDFEERWTLQVQFYFAQTRSTPAQSAAAVTVTLQQGTKE